jgi:4-hydroxyproline epimerase
MGSIPALSAAAIAVSQALERAGITGEGGARVDHVEFFGPPADPLAHSRNFVMCPGGAYDRSPCGTGTSAKLACLAADGTLAAGAPWVQESIVGGRFVAQYRLDGQGRVVPRIRGRAFVVAEATLLRDPLDPFADGMRPVA